MIKKQITNNKKIKLNKRRYVKFDKNFENAQCIKKLNIKTINDKKQTHKQKKQQIKIVRKTQTKQKIITKQKKIKNFFLKKSINYKNV